MTVIVDPLQTAGEGPTDPTDPAAEAPEDGSPEDEARQEAIRHQYEAEDWHKVWKGEEQEEWIVEPLLPARRLVALYSPPKMGKSLLLLELAAKISRGEEVLGVIPAARRVLYVDFENDMQGDIRTRLTAMGYGPEHLDDLVYLSFPSLPLLDTVMGGVVLLAIVKAYDCEVVVIDTISRAVGGDENDNDTWLSFYRHTGLALKAAGKACIRLDHTGKDEARGMRGGSAKYGDVDAVWSMTRAGVGDTFRLECTANRLQVPDKVLTVKRESNPLRHVVVGNERDKIQDLADSLDALGADLDCTDEVGKALLRTHGIRFANDDYRQAKTRRNLGFVPTDRRPGDYE